MKPTIIKVKKRKKSMKLEIVFISSKVSEKYGLCPGDAILKTTIIERAINGTNFRIKYSDGKIENYSLKDISEITIATGFIKHHYDYEDGVLFKHTVEYYKNGDYNGTNP